MKVNETINENFAAYNFATEPPDRIAGLNFSYNIFANGLTSNVPVSINETTVAGVYAISFVPTVTGVWFVEMTSSSAVMNAEYFVVSNDISDFVTMLTDIYDSNFGKWDMQNNQLKMYRTGDGSIMQTFNLFDINGTPSLTGVTRRIPL